MADVSYDALAKVQTVVRHLWDAVALICLEKEPLRYSQLLRRMAESTDRYLTESELTRARHRLVRRKLITEVWDENGDKMYSVTEVGRCRLRQIHVLVKIAPQLDPPDTR